MNIFIYTNVLQHTIIINHVSCKKSMYFIYFIVFVARVIISARYDHVLFSSRSAHVTHQQQRRR